MKKVFLAVGLSLVLMLAMVGNVFASTPQVSRLWGADRYSTSVAVAVSGWPDGSDTCVLVSGENFPDALSATPLAKKYNAPVLLTTSNSLPATVKQELINLKTKNCFIIGGTGVISPSIETELQSMGITPTRIAGSDRYETAIQVAQQVVTTPSSIFLCTGEDYPDALSCAPIAGIKQVPIILVPSDSNLPDSVKNYIVNKQILHTYVVGNTDVIADSIANQFPNPQRISGSDKYSRNIAVNQAFNNVFSQSGVCVATGEQFPDALAGAALASKLSEPIILVNTDSPQGTRNYYQSRVSNGGNVVVLGGNGVVSDGVVGDLGNNQTTPTEPTQDNSTPSSSGTNTDSNNNSNNVNSNNTIINNNSNNNNTTIINNSGYSGDVNTGSIKGNITWQYNKFIGTKADVGASIVLIPVNYDKKQSDGSLYTFFAKDKLPPQGDNGVYTAVVDGLGSYEIDNVPIGKYYLLIVSLNTMRDLTTPVDSNTQQILGNLLSEKDWEYIQKVLKGFKYDLNEIEIKNGQTLIQSHDFGYSVY